MKVTIALFVGLMVFAPSVFASEAVELCKKMYPLPERNINFVEEKTGHDPRQFLIRRCITTERKKIAEQRRVERSNARHTARFNKSSDRAMQIQDRRSKGLTRDLVQQQQYRESLRVAPHRVGRSRFINARASRRSLVRDEEGLDRINAIRRKLKPNLAELCRTVGAIGKRNNPCRNR